MIVRRLAAVTVEPVVAVDVGAMRADGICYLLFIY